MNLYRCVRPVLVFGVFAAVGFALTAPSEADAFSGLYSSSICEAAYSTAAYSNSSGTEDFGRLSTTGTLVRFNCPMTSDSDFTHTAVNGMDVMGSDSTTSYAFTGSACVSYWNSAGGDCGTAITNGAASLVPGTTSVNLTVANGGLAAWKLAGNSDDFPFVVVYLSPSMELWGFYITS